jgi:hypothetical protein
MDVMAIEKKKILKRKKEITIEAMVDKITKLTKEDVVLLLSGIAKGEIKDFTGLTPSLDVRIKAMDKLLPLIIDEVEEGVREIKVTITDGSNEQRIKDLETKIVGGSNDTDTK